MADYHYLSVLPFSCKSQKHIADSKTNTHFLLRNEVLQNFAINLLSPLECYFEFKKVTNLNCYFRYLLMQILYSITALEFNLFSALSGFTFHADKPLPLDIQKRRTFCGKDTSNSLLARRKLCFPHVLAYYSGTEGIYKLSISL